MALNRGGKMLSRYRWYSVAAAATATVVAAVGLAVSQPAAAAAAPVAQDSLTTSSTAANTPITATLKIHSTNGGCVTLPQLTVAVRSSSGANLDFPGLKTNASVCSGGYTHVTGSKSFAAGTYTIFGAYYYNGSWTNLPSQQMVISTGPVIAQDSLTTSGNVAGSPTTATLKIHSTTGGCVTLTSLTVAVRDSGGANLDFPNRTNVSVCSAVYTYTESATFAAGSYTIFGAYNRGGTWTNLPSQTMTVATAPSPSPTPTTPGGPVGPPGTWTQTFADEFDGSSVDTSKWSFQSSAEADWSSNPLGTGNLGNQQLEFDQPGNCTVSGGTLKMTTKPDNITSSSGKHYNWSSCMINTSPSYSYRYGYIEARMKMPPFKGNWPALWTWAAPGQSIPGNGETDAFEYYSDNKTKLYQTQHNTGGGSCTLTLGFDPTAGFHTYGVDIESTGTKWYVDGQQTCSTATTSGGLTNILVDNFVYSVIPPDPGRVQALETDYVRAWQH